MNGAKRIAFTVACLGMLISSAAAGPLARITIIEGEASLLRKGTEKWRPARPNLPLKQGDQLFCREESFVEIRYAIGTVVRLNENSKLVIESLSKEGAKSKNPLGDVWVNMKKITKRDASFELASPTAVAAIRGTAYKMSTGEDSSTSVDVYDGEVAVGPSAGLKKKLDADKANAPSGGPVEVPGPEEVPGPYEVSLEQWKTIIAGQRISIKSDGTYAQSDFDTESAEEDEFVARNLELDKKMTEGE